MTRRPTRRCVGAASADASFGRFSIRGGPYGRADAFPMHHFASNVSVRTRRRVSDTSASTHPWTLVRSTRRPTRPYRCVGASPTRHFDMSARPRKPAEANRRFMIGFTQVWGVSGTSGRMWEGSLCCGEHDHLQRFFPKLQAVGRPRVRRGWPFRPSNVSLCGCRDARCMACATTSRRGAACPWCGRRGTVSLSGGASRLAVWRTTQRRHGTRTIPNHGPPVAAFQARHTLARAFDFTPRWSESAFRAKPTTNIWGQRAGLAEDLDPIPESQQLQC